MAQRKKVIIMEEDKEDKRAFKVENTEVAPIEEATRKIAEDGTMIIPDRSKIYKKWFKATKERGKEVNAITRNKEFTANSRALDKNITLNNLKATKVSKPTKKKKR